MREKYGFTKMTLLLLFMVLTLPVLSAFGAENDYETMIETFFSKMESGNYEDAINYIYADNPWFSAKSDDVQKLKTQFIGLNKIVGNYIDNELMTEEKAASRFVFVQYFVTFDRQPLSFNFEFYKPRDKWQTFSFSYADDIDKLIEEKAKQNYLQKTNSGGK